MTGNTAMDSKTLESIVSHFGDDNVIGFTFSGGGKILKPRDKKVTELYMNEDKECLVFEAKDIKGVPYKVVHAVACVEAVLVVDDFDKSKTLDIRYAL